MLHHVAGRAFLQRRHRATVWQRRPGLWTDDAIDGETRALLKVLDGGFGLGTKGAINSNIEIGLAAQRPLQAADRLAVRAWSNGRLSRIGHMHLPRWKRSYRSRDATSFPVVAQ